MSFSIFTILNLTLYLWPNGAPRPSGFGRGRQGKAGSGDTYRRAWFRRPLQYDSIFETIHTQPNVLPKPVWVWYRRPIRFDFQYDTWNFDFEMKQFRNDTRRIERIAQAWGKVSIIASYLAHFQSLKMEEFIYFARKIWF